MANLVLLTGRLTAEPKVSYSPTTQKAMARYSLAVQRDFKNANGEYEADFINCICFGRTAEFAERFLHKGSKILVQGRIQTGSYEKDGNKVYTTDIIVNSHEFCESKGGVQSNQSSEVHEGFSAVDEDLPF